MQSQVRTPVKVVRESLPTFNENLSMLDNINAEALIQDENIDFEEFGLRTNKMLKNFDCYEDCNTPQEWL